MHPKATFYFLFHALLGRAAIIGAYHVRNRELKLPRHRTSLFASPTEASSAVAAMFAGPPLSRQEASMVVNKQLFPSSQHSNRMDAGRNDQGIPVGGLVDANDPRNQYTYGEFPLESFDELVDMGMEHVAGQEDGKVTRLVDLGSGCGRLVMYAALSRSDSIAVQGIEIGQEMHAVATEILDKAISQGLFEFCSSETGQKPSVELYLGSADALTPVLEDADLVFAYSTVWPVGQDWNVELSAMVLGPEWSDLLARSCRPGCVVVTTDRALDPAFGWELVDRQDVDNPEVFGSTGFIHVLKK